MTVTINRDDLLAALHQVIGAVERRNTFPILAYVLLELDGDVLAITATDSEIELQGYVKLPFAQDNFAMTLPGRKLFDICKALPDGVDIKITQDQQRVTLTAGRSRFTLTSLDANNFPKLDSEQTTTECTMTEGQLRFLIERTQFAMAQQDVRYYLNGMLFEFSGDRFTTVATDGHRLAVAHQTLSCRTTESVKLIVPRKGIQELSRLLSSPDESVTIQMEQNHIRFVSDNFVLASKLIDGRFPDYNRVLPKAGENVIVCNKSELKQILTRVSILSNEKNRGVRFELAENSLKVNANNPEQEQAEEEITVEYAGKVLSLGFNVTYLLDILSVLQDDVLKIYIHDVTSGVLIEENNKQECLYVVMPMRL